MTDTERLAELESTVRALHAELVEMRDRVREIETENQHLRADPSGTRSRPAGATVAEDEARPVGLARRRLLVGGATAGAAAVAGVVAAGQPAAAANGDLMYVGHAHAASLATAVIYSGTGTGFVAEANSPGAGLHGHQSGSGAGTSGESTGAGPGVQGKGATGPGVFGQSTTTGVVGQANATGVQGQSANTGVRGESTAGGNGVHGRSANVGVLGQSTGGGNGVWGDSSGVGVYGRSTGGNGRGVHGQSPATGVVGQSTGGGSGVHGLSSGTGVYGESTGDGIGVAGQGTTSAGVAGYSTSAQGVYGESDGDGVLGNGRTSSSVGVYGQSVGVGVVGHSTGGAIGVSGSATGSGIGVRASSVNGFALTAECGDGTGLAVVAKTNLRLAPVSGRTAPTGDASAHVRGDVVIDASGVVWLCVANGTPGTWRTLSGPASSGQFHVLRAPARVYDSRPGTSPSTIGPKTKFATNQTRTFDLKANNSGVPAGATAALVTLLLVNASTTAGNMTIWANGVTKPQANTLVWGGTAGRFTATAVTALDNQARVQVNASRTTDLVIDVVGYYR